MDLCLVANIHPGTRVSKHWWEQEVMAQEAGRKEIWAEASFVVMDTEY